MAGYIIYIVASQRLKAMYHLIIAQNRNKSEVEMELQSSENNHSTNTTFMVWPGCISITSDSIILPKEKCDRRATTTTWYCLTAITRQP